MMRATMLITLLSIFFVTGCSLNQSKSPNLTLPATKPDTTDLKPEKLIMPNWLKILKSSDVNRVTMTGTTITNANETGKEIIQKLIQALQQSTPISGNGFYDLNSSGVIIFLKNGEQIHVKPIFPHVKGDVSIGFNWSMLTLNGETVYIKDSKEDGTNFWNTIFEYKNH